MKHKQPIGTRTKRAGTQQTVLPKPRHRRELLPLGRVLLLGSYHTRGLQDRTSTQSELGSASKRDFPHASLLQQPKPEWVASPCPCHANGAQESHRPQHARGSPTSLRPQDPLQSVTQPYIPHLVALTSLASAAAAGRTTPQGALQRKRHPQHRSSWPPWLSAMPLLCRGQITFVFEVLQDRDDGLQRNVVCEEELPGAVLLKGLPVQALN